MLLTIFLVLLGIACVFLFLDYYLEDSLYSLIGFSFMFMLSMSVLLPGNLEYVSGYSSNTSVTYVANSSNINVISQSTGMVTSTFSEASSHFYGFWLAIISVFGFVVSLTRAKRLLRPEG